MKRYLRRLVANNNALIACFALAWALAVVAGFEGWRALQGHDAAGELREAIASAIVGEPSLDRNLSAAPANLKAPSYLLFQRSGPDEARAARAGSVDFAGLVDGMGTVVVIDHGDGLASVYNHLSETTLVEGQSVAAGQVVGKAGPAAGLGPFVVWFEAALEDGNVTAPATILGGASPEEVIFGKK